ncbi:MAG: hypothetical protein J5795_06840 [Lachnospiraceae bacterium]|nr:hypothetical protein [Lachnospiraceae bacterium]
MRLREWTFVFDDSGSAHKVTDIRLYSDDGEKIELEFKPIFVPENGELQWEDWNCYDSIMIYKTDYDKLLLSSIQSVFPVVDPTPNSWGLQEEFDLTSMNFIGKEDWSRIIDALLNRSNVAADQEKEFYDLFIKHLRSFMEVSEYFCIEGNL